MMILSPMKSQANGRNKVGGGWWLSTKQISLTSVDVDGH